MYAYAHASAVHPHDAFCDLSEGICKGMGMSSGMGTDKGMGIGRGIGTRVDRLIGTSR